MRTCVLSLCAACVLFFAVPVYAGSITEYSADMVNVQTNKVQQKIYVADQKMRFDTYNEAGKLAGISILRQDQGKAYALQEDKTYIELPVDKNAKSLEDLAPMGIKPDIKRESMGAEAVNEYKAEKFKVTTTLTVMGQKTVFTHYEWKAPEFDMPVRLQLQTGETLEMRNVQTGAPEASVFEMPEGYTRNTQMEEMMKQQMGANPAGQE